MRYRHWLLVAAGGALVYGFVLIRVTWFLGSFPVYGEADIRAATNLAVAMLLSWAVLEVVHALRAGRGGRCACGYSLKGVVCPECGRDLGDPPRT